MPCAFRFPSCVLLCKIIASNWHLLINPHLKCNGSRSLSGSKDVGVEELF